MKPVQVSQKRIRSVSLDVCGVTANRSIDATNHFDKTSPAGFASLLLAVSKVSDTANKENVQKTQSVSHSSGAKPGFCLLLDAATSVSPAKKQRLREHDTASEISDDEEFTRHVKRNMPPNLAPSAEEIAEATTFRSRMALNNWYDRLRELYEYKLIHNDCLVPQKYPPNPALGIWVNKQRMEKKFMDLGLRSAMTRYRLEKLDQVGFHWAKQRATFRGEGKYAELVQFYEKHGHCIVPTKYAENTALGRWISSQRSQTKEWLQGRKTHMTKERYNKLCAVNFQFDRLASKDKGDTVANEGPRPCE